MNMNIETRGAVCVVTVHEDRLDAHNSGDLKSELNRLFEAGNKSVLVELTDVRFIDSSGLGVLVSGFKSASTRQGSFKLCGLQNQVRSMFELTRLHRVFDIYATVNEALESW